MQGLIVVIQYTFIYSTKQCGSNDIFLYILWDLEEFSNVYNITVIEAVAIQSVKGLDLF